MTKSITLKGVPLLVLFAAFLLFPHSAMSNADIPGITGTTFNLTAKDGHIYGGDGLTIYTWGYTTEGNEMQYPGPTLIVNQGDTITVTLKNELPPGSGKVSLVFLGQKVTATGGEQGLLTREVPNDNGATTVTYTFTATHAGTYLYKSGTRPELQVEMGLFGALIVRPTGFDINTNRRAYDADFSQYDQEYLFLGSEMDIRIHRTVEHMGVAGLATKDYLTDYRAVYWFINGRNAPDTMAMANIPWMPSQPYNCMPMMHPGDRMLMRMLTTGRGYHPFHHHGNNSTIFAINGRVLESDPGMNANLAYSVFSIPLIPGQTADAIFTWTGEKLGWDIYGHEPGDPMEPNEYAPDHGKPLPVTLPGQSDLAFGGMWSGSPFLGQMGILPPGEGGNNPNAGYTYMWHSHTEKEMVNNDIFPGGMMTMMMVVPHSVPIGMGGMKDANKAVKK